MLKLKCFWIAAAAVAMSSTALIAQDAPTLRKGNTEIGLFVGGGYGLGISNDLKSTGALVTGQDFHIMGGGDAGYAITKSIFIVGEASYFPALGKVDVRTTNTPAGTNITFQNDRIYERKVTEYNAGVQYRLPVPEKRFVPYVVGALGGVHFSTGDITATSTNTSTGAVTNGQTQDPLPSRTVFALDGGAGLRYYVTEHFGFRGEFRIYRPFGVDNLTSFYRVAGGIFFQLK